VKLSFTNAPSIGKVIRMTTYGFSNGTGKNEDMTCQATIYGHVFDAGDALMESQLTNAMNHTNLNGECMPHERLICDLSNIITINYCGNIHELVFAFDSSYLREQSLCSIDATYATKRTRGYIPSFPRHWITACLRPVIG
jgi:hypothetical protein